jgi:2-polyprenyl-3-methyl-5-hydroxy-6-metoxy-1,4-benzoquinol methylase
MTGTSRPPKYFENLYAGNPDPWDFETSLYEREKYDATIAAIGGRHFATALEIGCSIGVLTFRLAALCGHLLAVDVVDSALARAKTRCASLVNVQFENRRLPQDWPRDQKFDLIVLSEMLYFLNPPDLRALAKLAAASLAPGGHALLVNYTEPINEPCSGNEAAEIFIAASGLTPAWQITRQKYRIDRLARATIGPCGEAYS